MSSAAEKRHMGRIAEMRCVLCGALDQKQQGRSYVHHIRTNQGKGQRASDFLTVPLCYDCHQGDGGLHGLGARGFYTRHRLSELDLLALTIRHLSGGCRA